MPNLLGQFQLENISTAISTLRNLKFDITEADIRRNNKLTSLARLQEMKSGKLKELVKNNRLIIDGSNENGSRSLNNYLSKSIVISMWLLE